MGVQNRDGLWPARAGSIRRGWQASKRHEGKEEDPPGAEGSATVQKWRKKQDRQGSGPPAREFQGKQQEGAWKEQMTRDGRGPGSRLPVSAVLIRGPLRGPATGDRSRWTSQGGRWAVPPDLCCGKSKFGGITVHFRTGKSKGFSVRIYESHFFGNKVAVFWIPCQSLWFACVRMGKSTSCPEHLPLSVRAAGHTRRLSAPVCALLTFPSWPVCAGVLSHSVVSGSLWPHGLQPARFLCLWNFPGKNIGVGCYFLLQGIFLTHGWKPRLLHRQVDSSSLNHLGSPSWHVSPC